MVSKKFLAFTVYLLLAGVSCLVLTQWCWLLLLAVSLQVLESVDVWESLSPKEFGDRWVKLRITVFSLHFYKVPLIHL